MEKLQEMEKLLARNQRSTIEESIEEDKKLKKIDAQV